MNCDGKNPSSRFSYWNPDDEQFWEEKGRPVAMRNLVASIHNLLCGFAVRLYWGMGSGRLGRSDPAGPEMVALMPEKS